jgi:hypothetical protein
LFGQSIIFLTSHATAAKEQFYVFSSKKESLIYSTTNFVPGNRTLLAPPSEFYTDHFNENVKLTSALQGEWILSYGHDGIIALRSMIDPENAVSIQAHSFKSGKIIDCVFTKDLKYIITLGKDGMLRRFDWKYNVTGRRAASELHEDSERKEQELKIKIEVFEKKIAILPVLNDQEDLAVKEEVTEQVVADESKIAASKIPQEKKMHHNHIEKQLGKLSAKIRSMIKANDECPILEKIERGDFVIDLQEKERLLEEIEIEMNSIRSNQEVGNLKRRVLKNRIIVDKINIGGMLEFDEYKRANDKIFWKKRIIE